MIGNKIKSGQAIFSKSDPWSRKYRFPNSNNSVIYADIKGQGYIRVYNMQLQSIKISPDVDEINDNIEVINKSKSQMLYRRISKALNNNNSKRSFSKSTKVSVNIPLLSVIWIIAPTLMFIEM
jgi:hypothetical protein